MMGRERKLNVGSRIIAALLALLVIAAAAQAAPPLAEVYRGKVLEIHDGDTPRVMLKSALAGDAVRWLRLADGVDCPESRQPLMARLAGVAGPAIMKPCSPSTAMCPL